MLLSPGQGTVLVLRSGPRETALRRIPPAHNRRTRWAWLFDSENARTSTAKMPARVNSPCGCWWLRRSALGIVGRADP
jgi:hypothetical protein